MGSVSGSKARRPFFCGNWKLQGTVSESVALATEVRNGVATLRDVDVVVAPSFVAIHPVARRLEGGPVAVAGQNCFWEDKGAFTGEVSAPQLVDAGCKFVILGHSERRQLMGELDAAVNLKSKAALRAGLSPIICVGETLAERDAGETLGRVGAQLDAALADLTAADLGRSIVAYEPVWAIGTG
ncbi:MAG: triosephosphate isomerase, partial [Myxococcales bacterium]|nr:triosephosphate isomerase [Myxococcales bacterium]